MNSQSVIGRVLARGGWVGLGLLLALAVAGCLTSRANDAPTRPPQLEIRVYQESTATATVTATATLTVTATATDAVSPTATLTATATATATATEMPEDTATVTLEPSATPEPTASSTPQPSDTPFPQQTSIPPTIAPFRTWAWVDNWYPAAGDTVTVFGRLYRHGKPVCGAQMGATWRYTCGETYCTAFTGLDGIAACTINIGCPLPNFWVPIDIVFIHEGETFYAQTGFLMDP